MRWTSFTLAILLSIISGNSANARSLSDTSKSACLKNAHKLLDEAITLMQKNYYKKNSVQWDSLLSTARVRLNSCQNCGDVYETINGCFRQINETHSFILPPAKAAVYNYDTARLLQKPPLTKLVGEIKAELFDGVAYITVPWISTTDEKICMMIADSLQQLIAQLDARGANKWIVDLRKNSGGNCWPMLAGIGPLLGNGICGYFVSATDRVTFSYQDGAAMQGRHIRCQASGNGYKLKNNPTKIAVLTGPNTSSSGEIVALAFKARQQVQLYGEATAGFTTANCTYTLSDNSMLVLTVCMEADRTGRIYEGSIAPDEWVSPNNQHGDAAKTKAMMWLQMQ